MEFAVEWQAGRSDDPVIWQGITRVMSAACTEYKEQKRNDTLREPMRQSQRLTLAIGRVAAQVEEYDTSMVA